MSCFAQENIWRDAQSPIDWSKGSYEERQRIEQQWEIEDQLREMRNELRQREWREKLDESMRIEAERLGYERTW